MATREERAKYAAPLSTNNLRVLPQCLIIVPKVSAHLHESGAHCARPFQINDRFPVVPVIRANVQVPYQFIAPQFLFPHTPVRPNLAPSAAFAGVVGNMIGLNYGMLYRWRQCIKCQ